jgi:16S rRNA processing protein RimM
VEKDARSSFIAIARIARTRGNRGEVLADFYTDFPDRFNALEEVWLEFDGGQRQRLAIEGSWEHKGRIVLKLEGIDSISSAEKYVGCWVVIPSDQAVPLPEGTYFDHELMGCSVLDATGKQLGIVEDILRIAGNTQLVVKDGPREYLIPATEAICVGVSIERKQILVDLPEGLLDLNK